jgi:hypothetical protein
MSAQPDLMEVPTAPEGVDTKQLKSVHVEVKDITDLDVTAIDVQGIERKNTSSTLERDQGANGTTGQKDGDILCKEDDRPAPLGKIGNMGSHHVMLEHEINKLRVELLEMKFRSERERRKAEVKEAEMMVRTQKFLLFLPVFWEH